MITSCFNRPNDGEMFDYRGERKTLVYFCLYDMDIETIENSQREGTDQRRFPFSPTEALTKEFVNLSF